jgi:hypothetical protein
MGFIEADEMRKLAPNDPSAGELSYVTRIAPVSLTPTPLRPSSRHLEADEMRKLDTAGEDEVKRQVKQSFANLFGPRVDAPNDPSAGELSYVTRIAPVSLTPTPLRPSSRHQALESRQMKTPSQPDMSSAPCPRP